MTDRQASRNTHDVIGTYKMSCDKDSKERMDELRDE